jgi:N-acyl homoserine lactone hydrolase
MTNRAKKIGLSLIVLVVVSAALFLRTFSASPLPAPPPLTAPLPSAAPPTEMAIFQLPTGVTHRSAAEAYRGGSFSDKRDFSMTAVLVKHPRGDLLIDTGFGRLIDAHFASMPLGFRLLTKYTKLKPVADQLAGYDRKNLRILLTHAHWDHVSGVADLAGTPVMVTAEERTFIRDGGFLTAVMRNTEGVRYEEYSFEDGPYLGFPKSHDVYGDGSIVVVPAPGHTPGSVIVFVTVPGPKRYAFVGDLVWQREGITEREERPWLPRHFGETDEAAVRENILRMNAIATRFPEITLVPAHDARGFAAFPVY